MAKKIRVIKKKAWKEPDEFISTSTKVLNYLRDNRRKIITLVVTALVVVLIFVGWRFHSQEVEKEASKLYYEAIQYYHGADIPESSFKDDKERYSLVLDKLKEVIEKYSRTSIEPLAFLYSGHTSYRLKEFDESIRFYEGFQERVSSDNPLRIFAFDGLGYGWEAKGDYKNALIYFRKIIDENENPLSKPAYFSVCRCYEGLGEKDKATETYQDFLANYPDSGYAILAKEKINTLKR